MDSGRFETFIDAIIAIMLTVMILKIPQPETMDLAGIWNLRVMYFSYVLSFIIIYNLWDHHRQLFDHIETINDRVLWTYSILIFIITLIPFFTAWVAHEPYAFLPELMFGILFIVTNIVYIISTKIAIKHDNYSEIIKEVSFNKISIINTILFILGVILLLAGYPLSMLIICLLMVVNWNVINYFDAYVEGDVSGN
jgi:uncharacterized membrane protein